jgi:hypothetical protein
VGGPHFEHAQHLAKLRVEPDTVGRDREHARERQQRHVLVRVYVDQVLGEDDPHDVVRVLVPNRNAAVSAVVDELERVQIERRTGVQERQRQRTEE